jgi:hypothetical protein
MIKPINPGQSGQFDGFAVFPRLFADRLDSIDDAMIVYESFHRLDGRSRFAHLKRILRMDKLRLRGFAGAQDEFLLAATAQNLRRMAKRLAINAPIAQVTPA